MDYFPLSDGAARQLIDAQAVFAEFRRVAAAARSVRGGMYWKRQDKYEYLVRTTANGRQRRIGPRSTETEAAYDQFTKRKAELEARLKSLVGALEEAERLNRALKVGRVPAIVVDVLRALDDVELGEHFPVVGTHALYAYETAAGVRIAQGALATQDVDLLWDARKRVSFLSAMRQLDRPLLAVLQSVDPTFVRSPDRLEAAINARAFEVEFLKRPPEGDDPHPFRFSNDEDDLLPVQALRAGVLTDAPRFEHVVVAATGRMALMRTIAPADFVRFKRWMVAVPHRAELKRSRDARQADIVQALLDAGLLRPESGRPSVGAWLGSLGPGMPPVDTLI